MASIQLKSGIKTQEFVNEKGKKLSLSVNIGDTDKYADWLDKADKLESITEKMTDAETMRKLKPLARDLVAMIFGVRSWRKINRFCGNNIFAVMKIIEAFSSIIKDGVMENVGK